MAIVSRLSVAEQQSVEIARALSMKSRLIVIDDQPRLYLSRGRQALSHRTRAEGERLSIIFVTHRLEEVMQICDRYTVLRDGRLIGSGWIADITIDGIIQLMVGREVKALFAHRQSEIANDVALRLKVKAAWQRARSECDCAGRRKF